MMKIRKNLGVIFVSLFVLSGCGISSNSTPVGEMLVYLGSCHIVGKDVYFSYNGDTYVAKNQISNYQKQIQKYQNVSNYELVVYERQDGSFFIPNN